VQDTLGQSIAYISMQDPDARAPLVAVLERAGWTVISEPTGFHLVSAISGVIEGDRNWLRPDLIIVDAWARGCAGTTIAAGLRELGITIPIVLVAARDQPLPLSPDRTLRITEADNAAQVVDEVVRGHVSRDAPLFRQAG
jgi:CheY-like chemotaxis protein